ncbi:cold-shock protein [Gimesia maris]|nr:cold shock domain-containing protein [Gimesia maris]
MRSQGKITDWDDEKGFGFISSQDDSNSVFVH